MVILILYMKRVLLRYVHSNFRLQGYNDSLDIFSDRFTSLFAVLTLSMLVPMRKAFKESPLGIGLYGGVLLLRELAFPHFSKQ